MNSIVEDLRLTFSLSPKEYLAMLQDQLAEYEKEPLALRKAITVSVFANHIIGFTGRLMIQFSTSDASQQVLPPFSRLRGNVPFRIRSQIVGNDMPVDLNYQTALNRIPDQKWFFFRLQITYESVVEPVLVRSGWVGLLYSL
jgi:hypothetical protein